LLNEEEEEEFEMVKDDDGGIVKEEIECECGFEDDGLFILELVGAFKDDEFAFFIELSLPSLLSISLFSISFPFSLLIEFKHEEFMLRLEFELLTILFSLGDVCFDRGCGQNEESSTLNLLLIAPSIVECVWTILLAFREMAELVEAKVALLIFLEK